MVYHFHVSGERAATAGVGPTTGEPESEAERVARLLRDQIVAGIRAAGSRLVERDIAAETGVSRVPVREALKTLVAEGLATPRPRTWAVVRTFTDKDIDDLIEVRSALETLAFRLAAQRADDDGLARLGRWVMAEQRAARAGDAAAARRAGTAFHELVVDLAANDLLSELFDTTRSRMRWLLGQHSEPTTMAAEHAALHQALVARDVDRTAPLVAAHLITSREAALHHRRGSGKHPRPE
jgi:DNA-binding GntR family transcriptional regulator